MATPSELLQEIRDSMAALVQRETEDGTEGRRLLEQIRDAVSGGGSAYSGAREAYQALRNAQGRDASGRFVRPAEDVRPEGAPSEPVRPPDKWKATANLLSAGGGLGIPGVGQIAGWMRSIKQAQEAWLDFQAAFRTPRPSRPAPPLPRPPSASARMLAGMSAAGAQHAAGARVLAGMQAAGRAARPTVASMAAAMGQAAAPVPPPPVRATPPMRLPTPPAWTPRAAQVLRPVTGPPKGRPPVPPLPTTPKGRPPVLPSPVPTGKAVRRLQRGQRQHARLKRLAPDLSRRYPDDPANLRPRSLGGTADLLGGGQIGAPGGGLAPAALELDDTMKALTEEVKRLSTALAKTEHGSVPASPPGEPAKGKGAAGMAVAEAARAGKRGVQFIEDASNLIGAVLSIGGA